MKKHLFSLSLLVAFGITCSLCHADTIDDFDTGGTGTGILSGTNGNWSAKWLGTGDTTQRDLYDNTAAAGVGGTNGVVLDVTTARRQYNAIHQDGLTCPIGVGNTLTLRSDMQVAVNGNTPTQNNNFFGLQVSTTPNWWDGSNIDYTLSRRGNATQQVFGVNGNTGWDNVNQYGLPGGANPVGTSDWFSMEIVLTDNGTTYDAVMTLYRPDGSFSAAHQVSTTTTIASGSTVYGGYTTGWNSVDPAGTAVPTDIQTYSNVTGVTVDNFSFIGAHAVPEPASLAILAFAGIGLVTRRRR